MTVQARNIEKEQEMLSSLNSIVSVVSNVDTGHEDMIHDAQMDFYGTRLATCSSDKSVKIFEIKGNEQTLIAQLRDHSGPVWQVAWAHPKYGKLLASCSYDKKVLIWQEDSHQWRKIHEYANHTSSVNSICWAPSEYGLILACASSDGSVSVLTYTSSQSWEAKKINNAHNFGCNAVSWAPAITCTITDKSEKTALSPQRIVTGGCDHPVKIWRYNDHTAEWVLENKLERHLDWIRDVAWAPSVGYPRSMIASCSQDRHVTIWLNDGNSSQWQAKDLGRFDDVIWHVSWSITGEVLAVSGGDNKVSLWKEALDGHWACLSDSSKTVQADDDQN